jgi:hypothetical protein
MPKLCGCNSGEERYECKDGHGIFLFFACSKCYDQKRSRYRDDIFERYQCDEPIEPEE